MAEEGNETVDRFVNGRNQFEDPFGENPHPKEPVTHKDVVKSFKEGLENFEDPLHARRKKEEQRLA